MRIAKPRESSKLRTHIALLGHAQEHACLSVLVQHFRPHYGVRRESMCLSRAVMTVGAGIEGDAYSVCTTF